MVERRLTNVTTETITTFGGLTGTLTGLKSVWENYIVLTIGDFFQTPIVYEQRCLQFEKKTFLDIESISKQSRTWIGKIRVSLGPVLILVYYHF